MVGPPSPEAAPPSSSAVPAVILFLFAAVCAVVGTRPPAARAGMIRDDRDPQAYVNLATEPAYASAGRFNSASAPSSPAPAR